MEKRRFVVAVIGFYLLGLGVLTGMLIEHVWFDESRSVLFAQFEEDTHKLHERLMEIERETTTQH